MTPKEAFDRLSEIFKVTKIELADGRKVRVCNDGLFANILLYEDWLVEPIEWGDALSYEPPKWRPATEADIGKEARFYTREFEDGKEAYVLSSVGRIHEIRRCVRAEGVVIQYFRWADSAVYLKCEVQE